MAKEGIVVGLDIGTSKVAAIISEVDENGQIEVLGVGLSPSKGLRKGIVINIDATADAIYKAISSAEMVSGIKVESVIAGVAGEHIKGLNNHGVVIIPNKRNRFVSQADVKRVINQAKDMEIPSERSILDVIPREFIVDDQKGIRDPVGMAGSRLEVLIHVITGSVTSVQNIVKAIENAGLRVDDIVLQPLASGDAVLEPDERELGVILVDIGAGTTDIVIYVKGSIWHTGVIPIGGEQVTNDIAIGLRTPLLKAEEIKKSSGCAMVSMVKNGEFIEVPGVGGRKPRVLPKSALAEIIESRMEEILEIIYKEIQTSGYKGMFPAGVVITGGASMLNGLTELAEQVFDMPVRIGYPREVKGLNERVKDPIFATGIGLVMNGIQRAESKTYKKKNIRSDHVTILIKRMKDWFSSYF